MTQAAGAASASRRLALHLGRFESCKTCYGRFYDAGEFRDFAEITVEDVVKRFAVKARF